MFHPLRRLHPDRWITHLFILIGVLGTPAALYGLVMAPWLTGRALRAGRMVPHELYGVAQALMVGTAGLWTLLGWALLVRYIRHAWRWTPAKRSGRLWPATSALNLTGGLLFFALALIAGHAPEGLTFMMIWLPFLAGVAEVARQIETRRLRTLARMSEDELARIAEVMR